MTPTSIQIPSLLVSISMMLGQIYSCITWQIKRNQYVFGKRSDLEKKIFPSLPCTNIINK